MGQLDRVVTAITIRVRAHDPGLVEAFYRLRWLWFVATTRCKAVWNRADVVLDIDPSVRFGRSVNAVVFPGTRSVLRIGPGSIVGDRVMFRLKGGEADIGASCDIRRDVNLSIGGALVLEGENILSWGSVVHCDDGIRFRLRACLSDYCSVADSEHFYAKEDEPFHANLRTAPIDIGENAWLAPKVAVLKGVTIGAFTIVAANAAVTKDLPAGCLAAGTPARVVRSLDLEWLPDPTA